MPQEAQKRTPKTASPHPKTASRRIVQRGLIAQISTALFQPVLFYETLSPMRQTRQWLWIGLLILALVGISAVQQTTITTSTPPITEGNIPPITDPFGGGGIGIDGGFGEIPLPTDPTAPTSPSTEGTQTADNWTIALVAASHLVLIWGIQATMLMVVPMFRGNAPQFGDNLQVAIYASLPLAIMAVLQVIFITAGGTLGKVGLSGLLDEVPAYTQSTDLFLRSIMLSVASQTTLFMLWSLMMVYWGGRVFLKGNRIVVILVVIAWVLVLVITPVVTEAIRADMPSAPADVTTDMPPLDIDMGGDMPPFDMDMNGDMGDGTQFDNVPSDMGMNDDIPADIEAPTEETP